MVTIQQIQQKLATRQQQIAQARAGVESQRLDISQRQLRATSPIQRQQAIRKFGEIKAEQLGKIEVEQAKQTQLKAKLEPFVKAMERQRAYKSAVKLYDKGIPYDYVSGQEREILKKMYRTGSMLRGQRSKELAGLQEKYPGEKLIIDPKTLAITGIESGALGMSLDISKYEDLVKSMKAPTLQKFDTVKLEGLERIKLPEFRGTSGAPEYGFIKKQEPYDLKLSTLASGLASGVGRGVTMLAEKAGVPTVTKEIDIPERRFLPSGTGILGPTGVATIPEPEVIKSIPEFGFEKQTIEIITSSPEQLGKVAETAVTLGLYAYPKTAIPLLIEQSAVGFGAYGEEIPTATEIIKEQTSELSPQERTSYLKTEVGKEYQKEVQDYVKDLEQAKTSKIVGGALAVGFLGAGAILKGVKIGKQVIPGPKPKPRQVPGIVVIETTGPKAVGVKVGGTYTPPWMGTKRWENWLSKVRTPRPTQIAPPRVDISGVAFRLDGEIGKGWGFTQRLGKKTTLKQLEQTFDIQKPIPITGDLSKMPKIQRYLLGKLPPRQLPDGAQVFFGTSRTIKGVPIKGIGSLRLERVSGAGRQARLLTRPPTLKEAPFSISGTRVVQLKVPGTTGRTSFFVTEQAVKQAKTLTPRATGKVTTEQTFVVLKQVEAPKVDLGFKTIIGKKVQKQLTQQEQEILVAKALQISPPKPVPTPKRTPKQVTDTYVSAPLMVGGLGKSISSFAGTGQYEITEATTTYLKPRMGDGQIQVPRVTTDLWTGLVTGPKLDDAQIQIPEIAVKLGHGLITGPKLDDAQIQIPGVIAVPKPIQVQKPIIGTREKIAPVLGLATPQIQKPSFGRPTVTTRTPPTRLPIRPTKPITPIIPPDSIPKKRKKLKWRKGEGLFIPFVRRFGKFMPIAGPISKRKAIKKGITKLRGTLAASLQLRRPSGEIVPFAKPTTKEFRVKDSTLIQVAPRRLKARGEKVEILRARKGVKFI